MMTIRVKMMITFEIDPEEYPMPADGRVDEEFKEHMQEYIHDIDGVKIKNIKALAEGN